MVRMMSVSLARVKCCRGPSARTLVLVLLMGQPSLAMALPAVARTSPSRAFTGLQHANFFRVTFETRPPFMALSTVEAGIPLIPYPSPTTCNGRAPHDPLPRAALLAVLPCLLTVGKGGANIYPVLSALDISLGLKNARDYNWVNLSNTHTRPDLECINQLSAYIHAAYACFAFPHGAAPRMAERGFPRPMDEPPSKILPWRTATKALVLFAPLLIIALVLGSLYAGVATPTEAASMGVLGAILSAAMNRRLSSKALWEATQQTGRALGPVVWIFFGANAMVNVYALAGGIDFIKASFIALDLPPMVLLGAIMMFLFVLGCFIDWIGIAFLTMPVFVPLITDLGMSPIWFGVLFCMNMQVSYLSPPFGPACFYLKSVAPPDVSLADIFRSVGPFIVLQAIAISLVMAFPQISLWPLKG